MITKTDLKDWLAASERDEYEKELEEYIDAEIKRNALAGNTSFNISTGYWGADRSRKTSFYTLWYTEKLSSDNRVIVQDRLIRRYREAGFNVEKTKVDCGWHNMFFALRFNNIHSVISEGDRE